MTATPAFIEGWSLDKVLGSGGFGVVELWTHKSGKKIGMFFYSLTKKINQ